MKVYPRVVVAIIRAARFLAMADVRGAGDEPIDSRGRGLEYAETREYAAGDDLRYMDWKATARFGKLMVKKFYMDAGLMAHLVYDVRASGPMFRDELSTTFLNTALGLAQAEIPFSVTVHDGGSVLVHVERSHPVVALRLALKYVLNSVEVELEGD